MKSRPATTMKAQIMKKTIPIRTPQVFLIREMVKVEGGAVEGVGLEVAKVQEEEEGVAAAAAERKKLRMPKRQTQIMSGQWLDLRPHAYIRLRTRMELMVPRRGCAWPGTRNLTIVVVPEVHHARDSRRGRARNKSVRSFQIWRELV